MHLSKRIRITGAVALTAGIGVALWSQQISVQAQNPPVAAVQLAGVQFTGEAPPPDGAMNLWYRQPASDHPYAPPVGGRGGAAGTAEWVKALPVGNGRLG